jgi:hypothetical protein
MRHLWLVLVLLLPLAAMEAKGQSNPDTTNNAAAGTGSEATGATKTPEAKAAEEKLAEEKRAAEQKAQEEKTARKKADAEKAPPALSVAVIRVGSAADIGSDSNVAHLGDWLTLDVDRVDYLIAQAQKLHKPLQLFLNGLPLKGVPAIYYKEKNAPDDQIPVKLRFELARNDQSKDTWAALLGSPGFDQRDVNVSVGVAGCAAGCTDITDPKSIKLEVVRTGGLLGFLVFFFLFLGGLCYLIKETALLHDNGEKSPWSLGRTQMAWWFFFVANAFVFIWVITGSYSTLTKSVLALIGISAGTGLAGAVIDDNKKPQITLRKSLETEQQQLITANKSLLATDPAVQANNLRLQQITTQLDQLPRQQLSVNFWQDILSDEGGISLHRYQMVIWTVVLTAIFVTGVFVRLTMPDFDSQLLALMGISSGTYIGFKFPEKQA